MVSLGIIGKDVLQSLFVLNLHVSSRGITTGFRKHEFSGRLSSLLSLLLVFSFFFFSCFFLPVVLFSFLFFTNAWTFRPWRWRSGGALGHGTGNHRRRRLGRLVDVVDLAPLALEGDLFPERLDEFLKSGNFPSELVFDIGVAVSESIDS